MLNELLRFNGFIQLIDLPGIVNSRLKWEWPVQCLAEMRFQRSKNQCKKAGTDALPDMAQKGHAVIEESVVPYSIFSIVKKSVITKVVKKNKKVTDYIFLFKKATQMGFWGLEKFVFRK